MKERDEGKARQTYTNSSKLPIYHRLDLACRRIDEQVAKVQVAVSPSSGDFSELDEPEGLVCLIFEKETEVVEPREEMDKEREGGVDGDDTVVRAKEGGDVGRVGLKGTSGV